MTGPDPLAATLAAAAGGRLVSARREGTRVDAVIDVAGLDGAGRAAVEAAVRAAALARDGVAEARVLLTAERAPAPAAPRLVAVASGKGGVGKSTIAANLAVALARGGARVGLVDADIHGPSQHRLLDAAASPRAEGGKLVPTATRFGVALLSMGQIAAPGRALAWRGPKVGGALDRLIDADWGDAELLVLDLPPGTGDVQLSLIGRHRPAGAVIVSTPQDLALIDAARAIDLFEQTRVPVIGLIENMSGYACPHCGEVSDPFGAGGAEADAAARDLPFLGRVPLAAAIRAASDAGLPPAAGDGAHADAFAELAARVRAWLAANP